MGLLQGYFERPQLEALVAALPDYLKDMTRFGYLTGMRLGEIKSPLRWDDCDREAGLLRLRPEHAKTGEGRAVALAGDLADLIERRWAARLFTRVSGTPFVSELVFHRDGHEIGDFRKAWATACKAVGVARRFHDLRRSAARNMDRARVSRHVAMAITGHKTEAMYNIVSEADLRGAAQKTQFYLDTLPVERSRG